MDVILRVIAIFIGLALVVVFFRSLFATTLLNRHLRDPFAHAITGLVWAIFRGLFLRTRDQARIDRRIIWFWPMGVFAMIFSWFALVAIAFAPIYWATGATADGFTSLIASGSALSTLGFATPENPQGQVIAIIEGAVGLFIVVYTITFLPNYLSAMQQRNDQVAWVYVRTGAPPTGIGLIEWFYRSNQPAALDNVWSEWEPWFRALGESHSLSPILIKSRSFRAGQDWLAGSGAMLDASALACSVMNLSSWASAENCFTSGVRALRTMALTTSTQVDLSSATTGQVPELVKRDAFDLVCTHLKAAGAPMRDDHDQAWRDFTDRRLQYESALLALAKSTLSRPPIWIAPAVQHSLSSSDGSTDPTA